MASAGVEGTATFSPGTCISQPSSDWECWAPNWRPPPTEVRMVMGTLVRPPDM